jgi:WD40 repeat protein
VALAGAEIAGGPQIVAAHASTDRAGPVRVWDLRTGWLLGELDNGRSHAAATSVVSHRDGDRTLAAVGYANGGIAIWDLASRSLIHRIDSAAAGVGNHRVLSLTVAEVDGEPVLVSAHADAMLRLWALRDGAARGELPAAPDGPGRDGPAPEIRALGSLLSGSEQMRSVANASAVDAREIVVGGGDAGVLYTWNVRTRQLIARSRPGPAPIQAVAIAGVWAGEPLVVTGHEGSPVAQLTEGRPAQPSGGYVRGWNPLTGEESSGIRPGRLPRSGVTAVVRHGQALALVGGQDGQVHVYNLANGQPQNVLATHSEGVTIVLRTVIDGHDYAVTGGAEGSVQVLDLDAPPQYSRSRRRSDPGPVRALAVATTGEQGRVVSIGGEGYIVDRDLATGDEDRMERLQKQVSSPHRLSVGMTPSGWPVVVAAERNRVVVLGHPREGADQELPLPPGLVSANVEAVAVRPVGDHRSLVAVSLASPAGRTGRVELYYVEDGGVRRLGSVSMPTMAPIAVLSFAVSSGPSQLTAVDANGSATVWDLAIPDQPALVTTLDTGITGPTAAGSAVVDGELVLAVGAPERVVEVWNVHARERRTRRPLACVQPIDALAVDTDGGVVISQGRDVLALRSHDAET